jgi:hypothetical protein
MNVPRIARYGSVAPRRSALPNDFDLPVPRLDDDAALDVAPVEPLFRSGLGARSWAARSARAACSHGTCRCVVSASSSRRSRGGDACYTDEAERRERDEAPVHDAILPAARRWQLLTGHSRSVDSVCRREPPHDASISREARSTAPCCQTRRRLGDRSWGQVPGSSRPLEAAQDTSRRGPQSRIDPRKTRQEARLPQPAGERFNLHGKEGVDGSSRQRASQKAS